MINNAITPVIIPIDSYSSNVPMTEDQIKFTIIFYLVCLLLINVIAYLKWIFKSDNEFVEFMYIGAIVLDVVFLFFLISFVIAKLVMGVL